MAPELVDFSLTPEQEVLRSTVARWGLKTEPVFATKTPIDFMAQEWKQLADMGILSLGSLVGGAEDVVIALRELGRFACPGPITVNVAATAILEGDLQEEVAAGEKVASIVLGSMIPFSPMADVLIQFDGELGWEVEVSGPLETIETSVAEPWAIGRLKKIRALGNASRAKVLFDLATGAYLTGAAERQLEVAASYVSERRQFGRVLGEFQAVAHPIANAYVDVLASSTLVSIAAANFDDDTDSRRTALQARLASVRSSLQAAYVAHQAMGAIGFTVEGPLARHSLRMRHIALSVPTTKTDLELLDSQPVEQHRPQDVSK